MDVLLCIMDWLETSELRSLAATSRAINRIVTPRLWRTFNIGRVCPANPTSIDEVYEACDALLRIPKRTACVRRLNIAPCSWAWEAELVRKFERIWVATRNLRELMLYTYRLSGVYEDNDFAPLIETLLNHGGDLRLRVFRYEGWLRPDSALLELLYSQPSIEELIGVDVFASRLPSSDPGLLPNLKVLTCDYVATAIYLLPGRAVETLSIHHVVHCSSFQALEEACHQCLGPLSEVEATVDTEYYFDDLVEGRPTAERLLSSCFPLVQHLRVFHYPSYDPWRILMRDLRFSHLRVLECPNPHARTDELAEWMSSVSPVLESVVFSDKCEVEWISANNLAVE